jgi:hypothetical protein
MCVESHKPGGQYQQIASTINGKSKPILTPWSVTYLSQFKPHQSHAYHKKK